MKFLLEVGEQLDLNVNWDGGGVDNVTYQVVAGSDVVSVSAAGIVEGLEVGTAVIEFVNSNVVVGSAIFEVLTAAQATSRKALRDGTSTLVVDAGEVPQGPPPSVQISINTMTGPSQGGYIAFGDVLSHSPAWQAFDADPSSLAQAYAPDANTFQTLGQILPSPKALTAYTITTRRGVNSPASWVVQASNDTTDGANGTWATIGTVTSQSWDNGPPTYTQPDGVIFSTLPSGMDASTKTFNVVNTTAYKAYRLRFSFSTGNGIYNFYSLVFTGY